MKRLIPLTLLSMLIALGTGCDSNDVRQGEAEVFSLDFDFDPQSAEQNGSVLSQQYDVPAITQNVLDFGAVLLYFRDQGTWTALPYTYPVGPTDDEFEDFLSLGYAFDRGLLEVFYEGSVEEALDFVPDNEVEMRAVIINSVGSGKTAIDFRDYEQVKRYYRLKD